MVCWTGLQRPYPLQRPVLQTDRTEHRTEQTASSSVNSIHQNQEDFFLSWVLFRRTNEMIGCLTVFNTTTQTAYIQRDPFADVNAVLNRLAWHSKSTNRNNTHINSIRHRRSRHYLLLINQTCTRGFRCLWSQHIVEFHQLAISFIRTNNNTKLIVFCVLDYGDQVRCFRCGVVINLPI